MKVIYDVDIPNKEALLEQLKSLYQNALCDMASCPNEDIFRKDGRALRIAIAIIMEKAK